MWIIIVYDRQNSQVSSIDKTFDIKDEAEKYIEKLKFSDKSINFYKIVDLNESECGAKTRKWQLWDFKDSDVHANCANYQGDDGTWKDFIKTKPYAEGSCIDFTWYTEEEYEEKWFKWFGRYDEYYIPGARLILKFISSSDQVRRFSIIVDENDESEIRAFIVKQNDKFEYLLDSI